MELKNNNQFNKNSLLDNNKNDDQCPVKSKSVLYKFQNKKYPIYYAPRQHNENLLRLANYNLLREEAKKNSMKKYKIDCSQNIVNTYTSSHSSYISDVNEINNKTEENINKKVNNNSKKKTFNKSYYNLKKKIKTSLKYPFIIDNHPILPKKYSGLPKEISDSNNQLYYSLKRDNEKIFEDAFSIVSKYKFSPKFRNPFQDRIIIKNKEEILNPSKKPKKKTEYEYKAIKALTIAKIAKRTKLKYDFKKIKHESILLRMKKIIIKAALHFKRITLSLTDLFSNYNSNQLIKNNSIFENIIQCIKNKDIRNGNILLDNYKISVLQSDLYKQTLLHWAAKRNSFYFIPKIVNYGADVDALDEIGFTPLHLAIMNNHFDVVVFLFLFYASPFKGDLSGKKPIEYAKNYRMKTLCKRAIALHVVHLFGKPFNFYENVKRGFAFFVESEYKNDLQPDAYEYVSNMAKEFRKNMYSY